MRKTAAVLGATIVAVLIAMMPLRAIGPSVLMFYGDPLKQPVFVTGADTSAFGDLLHATSVGEGETTGRPFIRVAAFWGTASDPSRTGVKELKDLNPETAGQHGRFFPPTAQQDALLLVTSFLKMPTAHPAPDAMSAYNWGGPVPPAGVSILQRLGVLKPGK